MSYLQWKTEPVSPPGVPPSYIDDWLLRSDDIPGNAIITNDNLLYDEQPTCAESASKLLEELNGLKEGPANHHPGHPVASLTDDYFAEPLPNWFEENINFNIDLSLYNEGNSFIQENTPFTKCVPQHTPQKHLQDQISLDQQFEDILDSISECFPNEGGSIRQCFPNEGGSLSQIQDEFYTLTPPITPANAYHEEEFTFMNHVPENFLVEPKNELNASLEDNFSNSPTSEHEYEQMDVECDVSNVEEKEESEGEEEGWMLNSQLPAIDSSSASTPENMIDESEDDTQEPWAEELASSPLCNDTTLTEVKEEVQTGDESPSTIVSEETLSSEDLSDDPDWDSPICKKAKSKKASTEVRKTRKPYVKISSAEERKVRKKEQNKKAATRYRMKKKMQAMGVFGEEQELLDENMELKGKVSELRQEVSIMKKLMRDLFRAKGLMK